MRPKYSTRAITLARYPMGEASASVIMLTEEFGLMRARVQGIRKLGAKLAPALQTLSESEILLVRGKDGWRLSGAVLAESWFTCLSADARTRAGRIASLILRLVHGESADRSLWNAFSEFLVALQALPQELGEPAEMLAALRIVRSLGLDAGDLENDTYAPAALMQLSAIRHDIIMRINRGLSASGL
jgi:recombinational DNA repair protein (RecF pathway)